MVDKRFISDLVGSIVSQRESYELEIKKSLHDAEIVKAKGPDKWNDLNLWIVENIEEANQSGADFEYAKMSAEVFRVARSFRGSMLSVQVELNKHDMGITVAGGRLRSSLRFLPRVDGNQIVYTQGDEPKPHTVETSTIEDIGKKILTRA
jgi:hypothetical protein